MGKKFKFGKKEFEMPYDLKRKEIYWCENCGFESTNLKDFKCGTKMEKSCGGVMYEVNEVARLVCPKCKEELEYHG